MTQVPAEEEEEDVWRRVVRGVRENLRRKKERKQEEKQEAKAEDKEEGKEEGKEEVEEEDTKEIGRIVSGDVSPPVAGGEGELQGGGLDRRSARRLRRGEMVIEGRLDLHGLSRLEARRVLCMGLRRSYERGFRCVLVISGKGRGILREEVMSVLNSVEVRDIVVKHDAAQIKDGGEGARYVLLRRKR